MDKIRWDDDSDDSDYDDDDQGGDGQPEHGLEQGLQQSDLPGGESAGHDVPGPRHTRHQVTQFSHVFLDFIIWGPEIF